MSSGTETLQQSTEYGSVIDGLDSLTDKTAVYLVDQIHMSNMILQLTF